MLKESDAAVDKQKVQDSNCWGFTPRNDDESGSFQLLLGIPLFKILGNCQAMISEHGFDACSKSV
jgi:hypothetical protein